MARLRRLPPPPLAVAVALLAVWLVLAPHTPDLAAQAYRVALFQGHGFVVWDEHWYGGHALPGYSLLFPPLGAALGVWALGALCVLCSTALFAYIVRRVYGARAAWAAVWFAVAAVADVWAGRITFALGVALALAAAAAFASQRSWPAVLAAALSAAGSPVAGALLALAGVTLALARGEARPALALALPPLAVIGVLMALFGEGGFEPYPFTSFVATLAVVLVFLWAVPGHERLLRIGAVVYLAACLACLLVHTPAGSNIERYGVLLAGPLLICVRPLRRLAFAAALLGCAVWTLWGPVRETKAVAGSEATGADYYAPVARYLEGLGPVRVEVPLTRSHWEAALLAPRVSLARGWEKQLDERYDAVLLGRHLTAAGYAAWLRSQAVGYVALADAPPDGSSAAEARLVRGGLPYLRLLFASRHWRVYRVLGATPLVSGPGRLTSLGHDELALTASERGRLLVRVRYSRYFVLAAGRGCVRAGPGGWTALDAAAAGPLRVAARFSLGRALGGGATSCAGGARAGEAYPGAQPG